MKQLGEALYDIWHEAMGDRGHEMKIWNELSVIEQQAWTNEAVRIQVERLPKAVDGGLDAMVMIPVEESRNR